MVRCATRVHSVNQGPVMAVLLRLLKLAAIEGTGAMIMLVCVVVRELVFTALRGKTLLLL